MAYHGQLSSFGQTEDEKSQLTAELLALESGEMSPLQRVRGANDLLAKLRATTRWSDSRSGISASFQNLINDDKNSREYLKSTDISARAKEILAFAAPQLTAAQAAQEGVTAFHRLNSEASAGHQATAQRLSRPGGAIWEVVRETPEPLVEEGVRRGGQVKEVGGKVIDELAPVGQSLVDELDQRSITNPLLGIVSLGLLVFMKRKLLAIIIILVLIYLTKQRQIDTVTTKVQEVSDRVRGTARKVESTADKLEKTVDSFS